jgi:hypothetical protein
MKNHVRDALLTVALFGSVSAMAASAPENSRGMTSRQSPKVSGHGLDKAVAAQPVAWAVFLNGRRNVSQGSAG